MALGEEIEDADTGSGGADGDDDAEELGVGVGEFGRDVDFVGGGEEVEEERNGEDGGKEDEAFGFGFGFGWERLLFRVWRVGMHARVQLGTVGRDVGGGSPRLEVGVGELHWVFHFLFV